MELDTSFEDLLDHVRHGDEDAATELVRSYEPEVRRFVHYRLHTSRMRRFLDSLDICQSIFAKFFERIANSSFELHNPHQLKQLLITMANNKLLDHCRKQATARRGAGKQAAIHAVDWIADTTDDPRQVVEDQEFVDLLRSRLTAEEQQLLDHWMNGDDWDIIAAKTGDSPGALRKRFTRAIDRVAGGLGWEEMP